MNSCRRANRHILTRFGSLCLIVVMCLVPLTALAHDGDEPINRDPSPAEIRVQKLFVGVAAVMIIGALVYRFGFRGKGQVDRWE